MKRFLSIVLHRGVLLRNNSLEAFVNSLVFDSDTSTGTRIHSNSFRSKRQEKA